MTSTRLNGDSSPRLCLPRSGRACGSVRPAPIAGSTPLGSDDPPEGAESPRRPAPSVASSGGATIRVGCESRDQHRTRSGACRHRRRHRHARIYGRPSRRPTPRPTVPAVGGRVRSRRAGPHGRGNGHRRPPSAPAIGRGRIAEGHVRVVPAAIGLIGVEDTDGGHRRQPEPELGIAAVRELRAVAAHGPMYAVAHDGRGRLDRRMSQVAGGREEFLVGQDPAAAFRDRCDLRERLPRPEVDVPTIGEPTSGWRSRKPAARRRAQGVSRSSAERSRT